jgi:hypothetical protein
VRAEDILRYLGPEAGAAAQGSGRRRDHGPEAAGAADDGRWAAEQSEGGGGWGGDAPGRGPWTEQGGGQGGGSGRRWSGSGQEGRWNGSGQGGRWSGGQGGQGGGRWSGEGRRGGRWQPFSGPMPRPMPVTLPDLPRRARLLLALHPAIAQEPWSTDFLPEPVIDWIARLAALPAGASFAQLVESLRDTEPELSAALQAEAAQDRGLLAELEPEQAKREFEGALARMRDLRIREEVDRLAQAGLVDEAQRARYAELQALRKALTSPEGT